MRKRKFQPNETDDVFIVETICKKKIRSNKEPLYLIKWKDWDSKYNTWEPSSNILDKGLIDLFEEEQKGKKQKRLNSKNDEHNNFFSKMESEISNLETNNVVEHHGETIIERKETDTKEEPVVKNEGRPKIFLKIPRNRIYDSLKKSPKEQSEKSFLDEEKLLKIHKVEDEWRFSNKSLPENVPSGGDIVNKSSEEKVKNIDKIILKSNHFWKTKRKFQSDKSSKSLEMYIHKPRKLLSINEYSAKMKNNHNLSKPEEKKFEQETIPLKSQEEVHLETRKSEKDDLKIGSIKENVSQTVLQDQVKSKDSLNDEYQVFENDKDPNFKPINERFKYHANTIITDITIKNLSVTIREMSYEDFMDDDDSSRYLMIRVPTQSDWLKRYQGLPKEVLNEEKKPESENCKADEMFSCEMKVKNVDNEKNMMNNITGDIISGFRPLIRPKSVDSYKAILENNYHSERIMSPLNISSYSPSQFTETNVSSCIYNNRSPLHVTIDDCEEVDVVGGIESDHSFVESLQTETVTVSIRQSLPINSSAMTSIIQSLLHSLPMLTPQHDPWIYSQIPSNHMYPLPHLMGNNICLPSLSIEPSVLKYSDNSSLLFGPSDLSVNTSQEMPIDLSLK